MCRLWIPAVVAVATITGIAVAAELQSGLQRGEHAPAFNVKDITGPAKGTSLCYR